MGEKAFNNTFAQIDIKNYNARLILLKSCLDLWRQMASIVEVLAHLEYLILTRSSLWAFIATPKAPNTNTPSTQINTYFFIFFIFVLSFGLFSPFYFSQKLNRQKWLINTKFVWFKFEFSAKALILMILAYFVELKIF